MKVIDKMLNVYTLVALNVGIIIAAEFIGNGRLLYEAGIIHIFAIIFVLLAFGSLRRRYYIADPILQKTFLRGTLLAFGVLSLSHVIEFAGFKALGHYTDSLWAAVINLYLLSLCVITVGAELFLRRFRRRPGWILWLFVGLSVFFSLLTLGFLTGTNTISLELNKRTPYLYAVTTMLIGIFVVVDIRKIGRAVFLFNAFSRRLVYVVPLIVIAAFVNIFYEVHDVMSVDEHQFIYLSHFAFYASQSTIYLTFRTLDTVTGLSLDMKKSIDI